MSHRCGLIVSVNRLSDPRKRPTLRHVALSAGVSTTTVSLVLNDKAEAIPADTQERVHNAARTLGYLPNETARSLRTQKSMTLALVADHIATTPFVGGMIKGVQDVASQHGYLVLVVNTGDDPGLERRSIESLMNRQIDGLLYATVFHRAVTVPDFPSDLPVVLLDARQANAGPTDRTLSSVVPDEAGGARAAIEQLIAAGHRRIGFVQNADPVPAAAERFAAYKSTLEHHGITFDPSLVAVGHDHTGQLACQVALALLDRPDRPTALFCFNDAMAAGSYIAAHRLGLSVPGDVSIVGFDNQRMIVDFLDPPLATVELPHYNMGVWAVTRLLAHIADPSLAALAHRQACPFVPGASVGPPPLNQTGKPS